MFFIDQCLYNVQTTVLFPSYKGYVSSLKVPVFIDNSQATFVHAHAVSTKYTLKGFKNAKKKMKTIFF